MASSPLFDDAVYGLPLGSGLRLRVSGWHPRGHSTFTLRLRLRALHGTECALRKHSILVHGPLDEPRELPAIILDMRLERRDARLSCTKRRAITLEHPQRSEQMIPRVRKRPLTL